MACQVEQIADCGDILSIARALFISERDDANWLSQCCVSVSPCGNLMAIGSKDRLCFLSSQWISASESNSYLISWSGSLPSDVTALLVLSICPSQHSSQNGPDWFCITVGFKNGSVGFYTNTGHLLFVEKLDDKPAIKLSCHTGTYGTLPDDLHVLYSTCVCIISGASLFQTLRNAKAELAKVQAGAKNDYVIDSHNIGIKKWTFSDQETMSDASIVGLELKNTYDHLLAASTYGGYDVWYRSVPPVNTLILGVGSKPYVGFHYALEGGTNPPLQDVARAVANKIKSALPGWLGGSQTESGPSNTEAVIRTEALCLRAEVRDGARAGSSVVVSQDRRLAAVADSLGRVALLDLQRGHLVRMFKGCRDAQCAFVQVFEQNNQKPQMSVIKEIRRAIFLIIYNPKKGLLDIRLMQRGNRVAVFTATKNGKLLYNTCGLVGAEKSYTHKKINIPEFQSVLIDPDGKVKKINIPFFYALEGEHSEKSKDLHVLRELRDFVKKYQGPNDEFEEEVLEKLGKLKTLEIKKNCLELLIRHCEEAPRLVASSINIFWEDISETELSTADQNIKNYFVNLVLLLQFYRRINNENITDMKEIIDKVCLSSNIQNNGSDSKDLAITSESNEPVFQLLEDDSCILERLLLLAQKSNYKDYRQSKVTFADVKSSSFKELTSCFVLDDKIGKITLQPSITSEKLAKLTTDIIKPMLKMNNVKCLKQYVAESNIDPTEIVRLLLVYILNLPLEDFNIEVINKFVEMLYYLSNVTDEASTIKYNETSPWWQSIRDMLVDMSCPLRSMIVAMACKAVCKIIEINYSEIDEDAWESVSKENAKWGILIGKLEDISILSIILIFKEEFLGKSLPKLELSDININLKYVYTRGKGSVTELIAKWLCSMGVPPEAIIANELMEKSIEANDNSFKGEQSESEECLFLENYRSLVEQNSTIFKWLSLLRRQLPLSTASDYIIANMSWEYAINWQKNIQAMEQLEAVVQCLSNISDLHIRQGLFSIIWSTYLKTVFESTCRLVNKVGKLPKEPLCMQDVGLSNSDMLAFLAIACNYLESFRVTTTTRNKHIKTVIKFEKIWDECMPSLVEVAQDFKSVNSDVLHLNCQICSSVYFVCHFNFKFTKPLDTLFDIDYQYALDALTGSEKSAKEINLRTSDKVKNARKKFLTKLIRSAVDTITTEDLPGSTKLYHSTDCNVWIEKITSLAETWSIDVEFVKRQQAIGLYHLGYDALAENIIGSLREPEQVLPPILAITTQRLKRSLEQSDNQPEWIVTVAPHVYKRLQNTILDPSIPAYPSLSTTESVVQKLLLQIEKNQTITDSQDIKFGQLLIETCQVLLRREL